MLHSFRCPQKQRIFNGAFSFCHDAKGGDLTLWCFVLKRSAKQTNVGECSVNILESHVQIFRPFWAKKSLNLTEDGFNCILHWLCHCTWSVTAFFNSLHNFTKKTIFFHCLFLPSSNPAPFSLHSSKVFIYLSYFHSTVINSCSAVQAGSGFYSLGIQAHHEKCCWYWYEGVLCINPPS